MYEGFIGLTERVAMLNLILHEFKISIIQVYAPTESAKEEEIEEFDKTIEKAMEITHKNIILMGDFNAKVGAPKEGEYLIVHQHGDGERNDRGQRLVDYALEHNLTIINTCFKKNRSRRWTWRSPNGQHKNEIDYILSNQPKLFNNFEVLNLNYPSDHRLIRSTLKIAKQKQSKTETNGHLWASLEEAFTQ
ncbi:craniofacial development protein 2-like [Pieris rapae]|uniref:craniofacial development protein 2-like n=1 Tax=Pieris rapae TaxID=64459 RepID=UPI001E27AABD|nr:craniofacial development protein 2-like [Pieris rapae]